MKYKLGAIIDKNRTVEKEYVVSATVLPPFVLTDISHLPVLNQGQQPACVGHAFANAVNYDYFKNTGTLPNSSPRWNYAVGKLTDGNTNEGTSALAVFVGCKSKGGSATINTVPNTVNLPVLTYTELPITSVEIADAQKHPISNEVDIPSPTCLQLQSLIAQYGVVPIAVTVDEQTWMAEDGHVSLKPGNAGGHEVLCFGYDTRGLNGDVRFFILNSWDTTWGNNGTGTFMWSDYQGNIYDAMSITVNTMPTIQNSTTTLIEGFEGCSLISYQDQGGVWTIGYGSTTDLNGNPVTANTLPLTLIQATQLLATELVTYANAVTSTIKVPLTQNQFDALVSFTFNCGIGALQSSTLCKNLNNNIPVVEANFTSWDKVTVNGQLVQSQGLLNRRIKEYELFIS